MFNTQLSYLYQVHDASRMTESECPVTMSSHYVIRNQGLNKPQANRYPYRSYITQAISNLLMIDLWRYGYLSVYMNNLDVHIRILLLSSPI
jgi:hypothetical protein